MQKELKCLLLLWQLLLLVTFIVIVKLGIQICQEDEEKLLLILWWDHGLILIPRIFVPDCILFSFFYVSPAAPWKFMLIMNKGGETFLFIMSDKTWTPNGRGETD